MKKYFTKASLLFAMLISSAAHAGVSVQFGQPGFYGSFNLGDFQQPRLIYREPRIIQQVTVVQPPMYLIVPPGHAKNWSKHCRRYNACSRPVYFVQESWYNSEVVPRYQGDRHNDRDHDKHHGHGRGHGKGHGHDRD
ncbi:hypothetical protein [Iodobacter fluviatilis]|uniref:Uncharacterized protein n=1 Tax=Iodobacter fluviatilis TaxID=537 RepID=A0A377Q758_9NEIS|nr:hypothetical protein [Iodobacter fluviatilis]TCU90643.1 hypothetical protein EV682_101685 [Iodobacter fluviatilis]STQ89671.1 Uncharacterised protein [Iodobacter fluviatilis]